MADQATPRGLGARIAELRREGGMTQQELATRAGVSISTVYRAEGRVSTLGPTAAARIAAALSVAPEEIYEGEAVTSRESPAFVLAEERHDEVMRRLDAIQQGVDDLCADDTRATRG